MKAGEEDGVEVDDLIGGVVIGDRVTAKVRTETCPLFWGSDRIRMQPSSVLAWVSAVWRRHRRGQNPGMPSLGVRTKTCPLFAVDRSGIIAGHVGTEKAPVVSSASERHGLCQRSSVFPDRRNRTSDLGSWRRLRALRLRGPRCRSVRDDHAVGIRIRQSKRNRPILRLLGAESPPLPGALPSWRDQRLGAGAGTAVRCFEECERARTRPNDFALENKRIQQPYDCGQAGLVGEGDSQAASPAGMAAQSGTSRIGSSVSGADQQ